MGGRGAKSGGAGGGVVGAGGGSMPAASSIANQAPSPQNTPVTPGGVTALTQMSDQQLAQLYMQSRTVDMPNHLSDASDATQRFVYTAGINGKPLVLDDAAFYQYLSDNNISRSSILSRSTNGANYVVNGTKMRMTPQQVTDLIKYGDLTYVGGKHGGQLYGAGTYFDRNGGANTGYAGGATMLAVLSPSAKAISKSALISQTQRWAQSHPQFASAVGRINTSNLSIYALAQGYNVITDGGSYHNVIDRTAMVMRKSNL